MDRKKSFFVGERKMIVNEGRIKTRPVFNRFQNWGQQCDLEFEWGGGTMSYEFKFCATIEIF